MLKKATKMTLYDNIFTQIQQLIQDGTLRPGDMLAPEREMAVQLGISRNTLREALKALELVGVLDVRPGDGSYINKDLNEQLISTSLRFISVQRIKEMLDLLEARRVLEAATACLAAKNSTPELVKELSKELEGMRENIADPETSAKYDSNFHMLIAEASGNSFLAELTKALREPTMRIMHKTTTLVRLRSYTVNYHEQLLEAIANKDHETAEKIMRQHILKIEEEVKKHGLIM